MKIDIDEATLRIIQDICIYMKAKLVIQMKEDVFKDNNYVIEAIDKFIKATENK